MTKTTKGKFIVIEGTDGSGKGTQFKLLADRLQKMGLGFGTADFPQYGKPSSFFVEKYLRGEYGTAEEVGPHRGSLFYALDRFDESFNLKKIIDSGQHLISNRYVTSNIGHQTGKIESREEQDEFLEWIDHLEYEMLGSPRPDMVIFLSVDPEVGQQLVAQKKAREYTKGKSHDIHEADINHLRKAFETYNYVVEKLGWVKIDCMKDGEIMTPEEIHELVFEKVQELLEG
jgi:dTMP kinase